MREKKHKRISTEQLKGFKGFENYTEEQAAEAITTLEDLSSVLYELYTKQKREEAIIINLNNDEQEQRMAA